MGRRISALFALFIVIAAVALLAGCTTVVKQSGEEPPAVVPEEPEAPPVEPVVEEPPVVEPEQPPVVEPPVITPPEETAPVETAVELPDYTIIVKNLVLEPKTLTIKVGDTVQWKNERTDKPTKGATILVRAASSKGITAFRSPTFYTNQTFEYTFNEVGKLVYIDAIFVNSGVTGTIDVQP